MWQCIAFYAFWCIMYWLTSDCNVVSHISLHCILLQHSLGCKTAFCTTYFMFILSTFANVCGVVLKLITMHCVCCSIKHCTLALVLLVWCTKCTMKHQVHHKALQYKPVHQVHFRWCGGGCLVVVCLQMFAELNCSVVLYSSQYNSIAL